MNSTILDLLDKLHQQKNNFLAELDSWTDSERLQAPAGHWNALQIIEHIMQSEGGVLGYMSKKTSSGWENIEHTTQEHADKSTALNSRLISRDQYKIPAVLTEPEATEDYDTLKNRWNQLHQHIHTFVTELHEEFYDRQIFNQPAAGRLNLFQTLEFLCYHILHHTYQLERLKQDVHEG
jgi:DinB superfamily